MKKRITLNKFEYKKRASALALALLCLCAAFSFCSCSGKGEDTRPKIVCTTFVLADWTREVLGEDAESFSIELLGANGADIHSYQPTVADIMLLSRCEAFVYIGGESDVWVEDTLSSAKNTGMSRLDLSAALEGELCTEEHEHLHKGHGEGAVHFDEHIWFSFSHTRHAVEEISHTLGERYPEKRELYKNNADAYCEKIDELEGEYMTACSGAEVIDVVVADRYPFAYLFDSLGLRAHAAFSGCSAESEASFEVMARLVSELDSGRLSYVLKCEDSDGSIAEAVVNNSKQKGIKILTLNSLQSAGRDEFFSGVSYLSLMRENLSVIKTAISK